MNKIVNLGKIKWLIKPEAQDKENFKKYNKEEKQKINIKSEGFQNENVKTILQDGEFVSHLVRKGRIQFSKILKCLG